MAVRAAGGVVFRKTKAGREVLLVHRPRYDDWSFPKGKADEGESFRACARREVAEECGVTADLGASLGEVRYRDRQGRPKMVRYWAIEVTKVPFRPNPEVDRVKWLGLDQAAERLTYRHDRRLLERLAQL